MKDKEEKVIQQVYNKFTNGYWSNDYAYQYSPMLFPFAEPIQDVRDAVTALGCKKDKDNKFSESRRSISDSQQDIHHLAREIERLIEETGERSLRYRKELPEGRYQDTFRDMLMMMLPVMSQKNVVSINLDINQLNQTIYSECESCQIRQKCREAFAIITEYVSHTLSELEFQIPTK